MDGVRGSPGAARPGDVVRAARRASGLTLVELGARTGYSAAQVSRYERGVTPLTDITVLRRFARALSIPPHQLGLAAPLSDDARHARLAVVTAGPSRAVFPKSLYGNRSGGGRSDLVSNQRRVREL